MPSDTREVLRPDGARCESRSLFFDRFCDPASREDQRKAWFQRAVALKPERAKAHSWAQWLINQFSRNKPEQLLFGQLRARLLVNMAGGVMEIPGSALKGCARRMALSELAHASQEAALNPQELVTGLAQLALVFGWGDTEWKDGRKRAGNSEQGRLVSDFEFACGEGERWKAIRLETAKLLLPLLGMDSRRSPQRPWEDLPAFGGLVSFLPAYPVDVKLDSPTSPPVPEIGRLELDVLTCHHPRYYDARPAPDGRLPMPVALDTEPPNPVVFPAVAAGHLFVFGMIPLRSQARIGFLPPPPSLDRCSRDSLSMARRWLARGLGTFGVGAKTAAGYGWFDCSEGLQSAVGQAWRRFENAAAERRRRVAEEAERLAQAEALRKKKEQMQAAIASLTPDQQEDYRLEQLTEDQFRSAIDDFHSKTPEEQRAIIRALRIDPANARSRRRFWEDLKAKAARKGGKPARTEQAIRALSKQMFPGKEGKMP
jgi:CRISPR type III-B/RAMP module RAMP protein Cmr6